MDKASDEEWASGDGRRHSMRQQREGYSEPWTSEKSYSRESKQEAQL